MRWISNKQNKQSHMQVKTKHWHEFADEKGIIEQIKNKNYEDIVKLGFSLFIIDIDEKDALEIRENYGSMVFSINEIKSKITITNDEKVIVTDREYQDLEDPQKPNCYKFLFKNMFNLVHNTNSILILDPYLFNYRDDDIIVKNLECLLVEYFHDAIIVALFARLKFLIPHEVILLLKLLR